jgi:hypothetical protein
MAVLTDGQRIETKPDGAGLRISQFQEYALRLSDGSSASAEALATKSQPTAALLASDEPKDRAELGWRLGLPLAALNFVLLALAITNANPRAAKSTSLAVALLAFVVYYNLMTVGQSWVVSGRMSMLGFLLGLHGWSWGSLATLMIRHHRWSPRNCCNAAPKCRKELRHEDTAQNDLQGRHHHGGVCDPGLLALFFFFDLVDEMRWGRYGQYGVPRPCWWCCWKCPTCTSCCPSPC